jgi:thiamine-monophosphate kinase
MSNEFELIKTFFKPLSKGLSEDELGIGDDGAVLNVPESSQLVVVTDTLVEGVHFPVKTDPYDIAWKALAVNLSDLAAMGAEPGFFSLSLTLPNAENEWLERFAKGLSDLASLHKIPLIGGDTTRGPLSVTITANGWVKAKGAVLRSGAQKGDVICVTQTIGDAAVGLSLAINQISEQQSAYIDIKGKRHC